MHEVRAELLEGSKISDGVFRTGVALAAEEGIVLQFPRPHQRVGRRIGNGRDIRPVGARIPILVAPTNIAREWPKISLSAMRVEARVLSRIALVGERVAGMVENDIEN